MLKIVFMLVSSIHYQKIIMLTTITILLILIILFDIVKLLIIINFNITDVKDDSLV